jgi:hypothetical protein
MPTTTKSGSSRKMALTDYYVYAPLGAGELLVEKTRELSTKAWTGARKQRTQLLKSYQDLAKRGERLVQSISKSAHTRRAVEQAKTARSQVKSAATSIRKTADATATATKAAVKKVG